MPDREKVINGLECCSVPEGHCEKCPYETDGYVAECTSALARDTLALLKEQDNKIDTLNTLILGYEIGAIKMNENSETLTNS